MYYLIYYLMYIFYIINMHNTQREIERLRIFFLMISWAFYSWNGFHIPINFCSFPQYLRPLGPSWPSTEADLNYERISASLYVCLCLFKDSFHLNWRTDIGEAWCVTVVTSFLQALAVSGLRAGSNGHPLQLLP